MEKEKIDCEKYKDFLGKILPDRGKNFRLDELRFNFTRELMLLLSLKSKFNNYDKLINQRYGEDWIEINGINSKTTRYNFYIDKDVLENEDIYTLHATPKFDIDVNYILVILTIDTNFEYYNSDEHYINLDKLELFQDIYNDYYESDHKE
jgi:hypothetical protein